MRAIPTKWADQYLLLAQSDLVPVDKDKLLAHLEKIETAEKNRKRHAKNGAGRIPKKPRKDDGDGSGKKHCAARKGNSERGDRPK